MVTITVNDDRSITITSDDSEAENILIADALDQAGDHDLERIWNETKVGDTGLLVATIEALRATRFLEALEDCDFDADVMEAIDDAIAVLQDTEYTHGAPKP